MGDTGNGDVEAIRKYFIKMHPRILISFMSRTWMTRLLKKCFLSGCSSQVMYESFEDVITFYDLSNK